MKLPPLIQLLLASISIASIGTGCIQQKSIKVYAVEPRSSVQPDRNSTATSQVSADAQALVSLGPRVAGTPVMEEALTYLRQAYHQAGYVTKVQTFTYPKFVDRGSSVHSNTLIEGNALNGSPAGQLTAPLVTVPNVGTPEDFASVDVRGAIAIVRRGEIRFLDKANNAAAAGAVGLIVVNNVSSELFGTLGEPTSIPVLALSGDRGNALLEQAAREPLQVALNVDTVRGIVTGRNVIAHLEGVTQPKVIVGAHYDSVAGSPGANDNASGTAAVLDMARNLAETELARSVWFIAFDGEEDGLHGSRAFVDNADRSFLAQLQGMVNFDMVGVNESLRVGGTPSLTALVEQLDRSVVALGAAGGSDHVPFAQADVPVLFFTRGLEPSYHTPNDKQVNAGLLNETVKVGIEVIKQMELSRLSSSLESRG